MMPTAGGEGRHADARGEGLIAVARLARPVGLRGEIVVELLTESRDRLRTVEHAFVGTAEGEVRAVEVEHVRFSRNSVVVKLSGVNDRTGADTYRGKYLFVDEAHSAGPAPGSYFVHQVVGLEVFDEAGTFIGKIVDVQKLPGQDVWVVAGRVREIMIPAVREFIRAVELERGRVIIRPIEGLIDEN